MGTPARPARRRSTAPRKGDLREQAILDTTEVLLGRLGFEAMTMADIAEAAGLSRGALYFYFGSKHEVLTALVARTVEALRQKSRAAAADPATPREAIETVMRRTEALWLDHGLVMRAAIDLSSSVPEVDALWTGTAEIFISAIADILERAGVPSDDGPESAPAMAQAICWMIERTFYRASSVSAQELERAGATCQLIWLRAARLGHLDQ
ncbi:TetR/AcrR family transcriptional regulator [Streptomyces sp. NBC_01476]|uniref:TetR/AcrR family transcriptional regulator n=1 Tax=Streptomyces sp. NBC_01476 TaxID=2903881 RepID=UPI002E356AB1|nr:TetR/AcrR family transcriptional regulator [Streptomyces sp. NBC_01476]